MPAIVVCQTNKRIKMRFFYILPKRSLGKFQEGCHSELVEACGGLRMTFLPSYCCLNWIIFNLQPSFDCHKIASILFDFPYRMRQFFYFFKLFISLNSFYHDLTCKLPLFFGDTLKILWGLNPLEGKPSG